MEAFDRRVVGLVSVCTKSNRVCHAFVTSRLISLARSLERSCSLFASLQHPPLRFLPIGLPDHSILPCYTLDLTWLGQFIFFVGISCSRTPITTPTNTLPKKDHNSTRKDNTAIYGIYYIYSTSGFWTAATSRSLEIINN